MAGLLGRKRRRRSVRRGLRLRSLAASTDPRTVSRGGRCESPVARAIGGPRWGSRFRSIRRDPLIARPLRHKLAGIIDRLRFFNESNRTERPTPLLKGGVGERLWSLGEEASDPRHESKCAIRNSGGPLSQSGGSAFGVLGAKPER